VKDYSSHGKPTIAYFEDLANPNTPTRLRVPGPEYQYRTISDPAEIVRRMGVTEVTDDATN
jgi:hypothetical protein